MIFLWGQKMGSLERHGAEVAFTSPAVLSWLSGCLCSDTLADCGNSMNSLSRTKDILHTSKYSIVLDKNRLLCLPGSLEPCFGWCLIWMTLLKRGQPKSLSANNSNQILQSVPTQTPPHGKKFFFLQKRLFCVEFFSSLYPLYTFYACYINPFEQPYFLCLVHTLTLRIGQQVPIFNIGFTQISSILGHGKVIDC